ncbi:MAG: hypothetical protein LBI19_04435 [Oscillospiraceae bacterium]|jgi:hypothetical protein|nr:hypothetical protein [Oscillospiraceae bacterium]
MRLKDMSKAMKMKKHHFPEDVISQFDLIMQTDGEYGSRENPFVDAMDRLLTEEQRLLLWEVGGSCTGGGRYAKTLRDELAGKPLPEKIEALNQNKHFYDCHLNEDGTVTAYAGCHCLQHRAKGTKPEKTPSAYGCAAGAAFQNIRDALDVKGKARMKSIDYPVKGDGKGTLSFVFEVLA